MKFYAVSRSLFLCYGLFAASGFATADNLKVPPGNDIECTWSVTGKQTVVYDYILKALDSAQPGSPQFFSYSQPTKLGNSNPNLSVQLSRMTGLILDGNSIIRVIAEPAKDVRDYLNVSGREDLLKDETKKVEFFQLTLGDLAARQIKKAVTITYVFGDPSTPNQTLARVTGDLECHFLAP